MLLVKESGDNVNGSSFDGSKVNESIVSWIVRPFLGLSVRSNVESFQNIGAVRESDKGHFIDGKLFSFVAEGKGIIVNAVTEAVVVSSWNAKVIAG